MDFSQYTWHGKEFPPGWEPPYQFVVLATRVVDGDTVDVVMDLGFRQLLEDRLRLGDDFDAWEKRRPTYAKGKAAAARLAELLATASSVMVKTDVDLQARAKQGKFGRYIGVLYVWNPDLSNWLSVARVLRSEGHAKIERDDDEGSET